MESTARSALLICTVADLAIPSLFGTVGVMADEASNPHFASVASVEEAAALLTFTPRQPRRTAERNRDLTAISLLAFPRELSARADSSARSGSAK